MAGATEPAGDPATGELPAVPSPATSSPWMYSEDLWQSSRARVTALGVWVLPPQLKKIPGAPPKAKAVGFSAPLPCRSFGHTNGGLCGAYDLRVSSLMNHECFHHGFLIMPGLFKKERERESERATERGGENSTFGFNIQCLAPLLRPLCCNCHASCHHARPDCLSHTCTATPDVQPMKVIFATLLSSLRKFMISRFFELLAIWQIMFGWFTPQPCCTT